MLCSMQQCRAAELHDGELLQMEVYHSKQNNTIAAWCEFDYFEGVRVGHGVDTPYSSAWAEIYPDRVEVFNNTFDPFLVARWEHGLEIKGQILVVIQALRNEWAKIRICSKNGVSESPEVRFRGSGTECYLQPMGQAVRSAGLRYVDNDKQAPVWLFGDSFMEKYPPHLIAMGYGNFALDGHSGRNSRQALASLKHALKYVPVPELLIWAMGMNDPDTETEINADWLEAAREMMNVCQERGITPVLCTVPNTPVRNHSFKNAFIRESGVRVCDLDASVHAVGCRDWYPGLIREDEVHPMEAGSRVLALKMIAEIPELQEI